MKLLIDEGLSVRVVERLRDAGHNAVHVGDLDLLGAPDTQVKEAARGSGRAVVSLDTDFGEMLAIGQHPDQQAALLLAALEETADDIDAGAIVVLSRERARIRRLPI